jgi:hypothetical protein
MVPDRVAHKFGEVINSLENLFEHLREFRSLDFEKGPFGAKFEPK